MLLVCPSCASSYNIPVEKLGKGRTVRCKHCQACWYAAPPDAFSAAVAPILAAADEEAHAMLASMDADGTSSADLDDPLATARIETAEEAPADAGEREPTGASGENAMLRDMTDLDRERRDSSDLDGEVVAVSARAVEISPDDRPAQAAKPSLWSRLAAPLGLVSKLIVPRPQVGVAAKAPAPSSPVFQTIPPARRAAAPPPRRRSWLMAAAPYGAFAASCLLVAALAARGSIMSAAPGTARLYAALGLADESAPVAIVSVRSEIGSAEGGDVLLVEGELASRARQPVNVPGIRVVVRDGQGVELYAWPAQSLKLTLDPGERTVFRARLAAPPPAGKTVQVKFETG